MSQLSVNAIRFLGIDAIEKSKSGHPGVVMGAAPMAYDLFTKQLRINPEQPNWINRDRFVLSAGHGSMLLYALLHLSGFKDVSMEEIKNFRQWGSKTPGHPEFGHTAGVDATTGPLGQGISTATGFAQAERFLAAKYNREGYPIFDHYTYVICGDGDLMEGVSAEAASYAGLQKLDKLVVLYDSNDINLDGETKDSFTEDVRARYEAYGWHTALVEDGTDLAAIDAAINEAKASGKPSLIEVKTVGIILQAIFLDIGHIRVSQVSRTAEESWKHLSCCIECILTGITGCLREAIFKHWEVFWFDFYWILTSNDGCYFCC